MLLRVRWGGRGGGGGRATRQGKNRRKRKKDTERDPEREVGSKRPSELWLSTSTAFVVLLRRREKG